ncbi:hypothetical protein CYY_001042 [Polysphondylium violaceum]|uniref:GATOR1 complex protein NPRL3 C-terminal HTH domain-containing protein n=1 Tax=Polysphondylium violaceum TaxID=133409 RepID=A0A8J4V1Y0_9MYCE|nr:hypothetical protein CYY_001042 [Polysphondylium violaceum]
MDNTSNGNNSGFYKDADIPFNRNGGGGDGGLYDNEIVKNNILGIILVVHTSIGGDKLIFRYPTVSRTKVSDETLMAFKQQHPLTTLNPNQPGSNKGASVETENSQTDTGTSTAGGAIKEKFTIYNLPSVVITPILTPKQRLCDQSFELTIENTTFIGHPTNLTNEDLEEDEKKDHNHHSEKNSDGSSSNSNSNSNNNSNNNKSSDSVGNENESSIRHSQSSTTSSTTGENDDENNDDSNSNTDSPSSNTIRTSSSQINNSKKNCGEDRPKNQSTRNKKNIEEKKQHQHEEITLFNIVFVLSSTSGDVYRNKLLDSVKRISMQLAAAIKHEQQRCNYIAKQVHDMLAIREQWLTEQTQIENSGSSSAMPNTKPNHHVLTERILSVSKLAREIKEIYHGIKDRGSVSLRVNGWIGLHLNVSNPDSYPIYPLRPYHALLIFTGEDSIQLPSYDTSPALIKLLEAAKPTKSFRDLQLETDLTLAQIYRLASHLVHWKKARIINMMTKNNFYILTPRSQVNYATLSQTFSVLFPDFKLYDILQRFSTARPLAEHISKIPSSQYHTTFLAVVGWLLQHDLIVQLSTYIHLMIHTPSSNPAFATPSGSSSNAGSNTGSDASPLLYPTTPFPLMPSHLTPQEMSLFENIDDNTKLFQLFKRLSPYFRGLHHLEEIMWRENISRDELNKILKKYKNFLVQVVHEGNDKTNFQGL